MGGLVEFLLGWTESYFKASDLTASYGGEIEENRAMLVHLCGGPHPMLELFVLLPSGVPLEPEKLGSYDVIFHKTEQVNDQP